MRQPFKIAIALLSVGLSVAIYRSYLLTSPENLATGTPQSNIPSGEANKGAAQTDRAALASKGAAVINPADKKWVFRTQPPAEATIKEIIAPELPAENKHAVLVTVTAVDPQKFWAAQMVKQVPQEVRANRKMSVHFWARSLQSTPVWVIFEEGKSPHTPELQSKVTFTPQWKQYELPFRTTQNHIEPHANFCIKVGIQTGEIEVAGIYVDELQ